MGVRNHTSSSPSLLSRLLLRMRRLRERLIKVCRRRRRDGAAGSVANMDDLPLAVMSDILSRLPIEDIMTCRFVCKSWDDLITNSTDLVHLHWSRSTKSSQPPSLLLQDVNLSTETTDFLLVSRPNNAKQWNRIKILTAQKIPGRVVASCNGMLCIEISSKNQIFIYNPLTRKRLMLPELDFKLASNTFTYGFGFDPTKNKYKVMVAFQGCGRIITLGEDRWREIEFLYDVTPDINSFFFNGCFHWIPSPPVDGNIAAACDISTEKCHIVTLSSFPVYILTVDDSRCAFRDDYIHGDIHIQLRTWKLRDGIYYQYGNLGVNMIPARCVNILETKSRLLSVIGNGDFLLMGSGEQGSDVGQQKEDGHERLTFYDSERKEISFLEIEGVPNFFEAMLFVPSLICPNTL